MLVHSDELGARRPPEVWSGLKGSGPASLEPNTMWEDILPTEELADERHRLDGERFFASPLRLVEPAWSARPMRLSAESPAEHSATPQLGQTGV